MNKNIIVCSDGTGNSGGKSRGTNVWRLYNAVDLIQASSGASEVKTPQQISYYDDGVGTEDLQWTRHITGAFGIGISRNIRQLYQFLSTQFDSADAESENVKIFLFGFSRGAYTIRSLANMIDEFGIINGKFLPPDELKRQVKALYSVYRSKPAKREKRMEALKTSMDSRRQIAIEFLGAWDTVDAIGLPIYELKYLVDKFSLRAPHKHGLTPSTKNTYHALAIDDERHSFHPVMFDESQKQATQVVEQVWFAGMHSNIGGGYPKDHLSYISLLWMIAKAEKSGLKFDAKQLEDFRQALDINGKIYDSRSGFGSYYRYLPRNIKQLCQLEGRCRTIVHQSVLERIRNNYDLYFPVNIPTQDVKINGNNQPNIDSSERELIQKEAQGYVYWRRLTYNLTVALTLVLLWYVIDRQYPNSCPGLDPVSWLSFSLSNSFSIACILAIGVLFGFNKVLKRKLTTVGWRAWFAELSKFKLQTDSVNNNVIAERMSESAVKTYDQIEKLGDNSHRYTFFKTYKWIPILGVFFVYFGSLFYHCLPG